MEIHLKKDLNLVLTSRPFQTSLSRLSLSREENLSIAGQHWKNSMETALKDGADVKHFHWVRFEAILASPERLVREICDFLEFPYDSKLLPSPDDKLPWDSIQDHKWYPLRTDLNDRYLQELTSRDISIIKAYCGSLNDKFGYSPDMNA